MRIAVTELDYFNAVRAEKPTLKQQLRKEAFESVQSTLYSGEIDRSSIIDEDCDASDEANLHAIAMDCEGRVRVRLSFTIRVDDLDLAKLQLPSEQEERIVAILKELRRAKTRKEANGGTR